MKEKKQEKKQDKKVRTIKDNRLDELARRERENYSSRSWNILTSGGFYN